MTVEEVYSKICGDYQGVIGRLMSEDRVKRFVLKFLNDTSCNTLIDAIEKEEVEEAFRAAHTLKGICQNLGFTKLHESSSDLCELLRGGTLIKDRLLLEKVIEDYNETIEAISKLDE